MGSVADGVAGATSTVPEAGRSTMRNGIGAPDDDGQAAIVVVPAVTVIVVAGGRDVAGWQLVGARGRRSFGRGTRRRPRGIVGVGGLGRRITDDDRGTGSTPWETPECQSAMVIPIVGASRKWVETKTVLSLMASNRHTVGARCVTGDRIGVLECLPQRHPNRVARALGDDGRVIADLPAEPGLGVAPGLE